MGLEAIGIPDLWVPLLAELKAQQQVKWDHLVRFTVEQIRRGDWPESSLYRKPWPDPVARIGDPMTLVCQVCHVPFIRTKYGFVRTYKKLCSDNCIRLNRNIKANQYYHTHHPINKARVARLEAALEGKTCKHCGEPITDARRTTRLYCSNTCNVAAFRERHRPR
jgi:hypothetical protein